MKRYTLLLLLFVYWGCDISNNDIQPDKTFVKIYDDNRFEQEYYPIDIAQTPDNGFLILSELKFDQSLFTSVYILKTDAMGNMIAAVQMDDPYVNAVAGWSEINGTFYFICMDANNLSCQLVPVDDAGTPGTPVPIGGLTYPLVARQDDNNVTLLSFDNSNSESVISVISANGQVTKQASYSIGAGVDVEKPIIDHLTRNGARLPFTVGKTTDGKYYFNGFYNYTFSLVFTNFSSSPTGVCQGQLSQGGISAVASLGNDVFGVARFNFGASYINPQVGISSTSITSSIDLGGNTFPELESGSRVQMLNITENKKWLYGSNTQSKQLVLYGFDQETSNITRISYLGNGNPYSFASFTNTKDGGIAVLAETAIEGRFPRIALFKRDKEFLVNLTGN